MSFDFGGSSSGGGGFGFGGSSGGGSSDFGFGSSGSSGGTSSGLFGGFNSSSTSSNTNNSNNNNSNNAFGGGGGGGSSSAFGDTNSAFGNGSSSAFSGNTQAANFVKRNTLYKNCPANVQKAFLNLESHIQKLRETQTNIDEHFKNTQKTKKKKALKALLDDLSRNVIILNSFIKKTQNSTALFDREVRNLVRNKEKAIHLSYRVQERNPTYQERPQFPSPYFVQKLREYREKMTELSKEIYQLEQFIQSSLQSQSVSTPKALTETIRRHHDGFINITAKVQQIAGLMTELRKRYRAFRLKYRNDTKDPFEVKKPRKVPKLTFPMKNNNTNQQQNNNQSGSSLFGSGSGFGSSSNGNSGGLFGNSSSSFGSSFGDSGGGGLFGDSKDKKTNDSGGGFGFGSSGNSGFGSGFGGGSSFGDSGGSLFGGTQSTKKDSNKKNKKNDPFSF